MAALLLALGAHGRRCNPACGKATADERYRTWTEACTHPIMCGDDGGGGGCCGSPNGAFGGNDGGGGVGGGGLGGIEGGVGTSCKGSRAGAGDKEDWGGDPIAAR